MLCGGVIVLFIGHNLSEIIAAAESCTGRDVTPSKCAVEIYGKHPNA